MLLVAVKIPVQASVSSPSQRKGQALCRDLAALRMALRQARLAICKEHRNMPAKWERLTTEVEGFHQVQIMV